MRLFNVRDLVIGTELLPAEEEDEARAFNNYDEGDEYRDRYQYTSAYSLETIEPQWLILLATPRKCFLVDQVGPERPWSTTQHHGPAGAPGPLLVHLDPAWSTLCIHIPEIADQGGSRWTRGTLGTMELGVGPGALWSCFYILLMYSQDPSRHLSSLPGLIC